MPSTHDDLTRLDELRESMEILRSRLIDLEAMAHAATEIMDMVPYLPRRPRKPRADKPAWTEHQRRNRGRVQALIFATAEAAERALSTMEAVLDDIEHGGPTGGAAQGSDSSDPGDTGAANGSTGHQTRSHDNAAGISCLPRSRRGIVLDVQPIPPIRA